MLFMALTPSSEKTEGIVEILAVDHSNTLRRECLTQIIVLIIELIISFQTQIAAFR